MGRSERDLAIEAIGAACADAGLPVTAIDGLVSYHIEQVAEVDLVTTLGLPDLRFMARTPSGGGGAASVLGLSAVAVISGAAEGGVVRQQPEPGWPPLGESQHAPARLPPVAAPLRRCGTGPRDGVDRPAAH